MLGQNIILNDKNEIKNIKVKTKKINVERKKGYLLIPIIK